MSIHRSSTRDVGEITARQTDISELVIVDSIKVAHVPASAIACERSHKEAPKRRQARSIFSSLTKPNTSVYASHVISPFRTHRFND